MVQNRDTKAEVEGEAEAVVAEEESEVTEAEAEVEAAKTEVVGAEAVEAALKINRFRIPGSACDWDTIIQAFPQAWRQGSVAERSRARKRSEPSIYHLIRACSKPYCSAKHATPLDKK